MEVKALELLIHGRVQGVGFRASLCSTAQALGLVGWVKNNEDGTVRAFVQGSPDALDSIVEWCWIGPPSSEVMEVHVEPMKAGAFQAFEIKKD